MSLSLQLNLRSDNKVSVINSINKEEKLVTLNYIKEACQSSLDLLIQYKFYEVCINAERVWNQIQYFNSHAEAEKEIEVEQKFSNIMSGSDKLKITDHDKYMYKKALSTLNIYDPQEGIGKTITMIHQLEKFGWSIITKDNNFIIMSHHDKLDNLIIPNRNEMSKETLKSFINQADLTVNEFFSLT